MMILKKLSFLFAIFSLAPQMVLASSLEARKLSNLEIFEEFKRRGLSEDLTPAYFEVECVGSAIQVRLYDIPSSLEIPLKKERLVATKSYSLVQARGIRPEDACQRELGDQARKGLFIHTQAISFCNGSTQTYVYMNSDDLSIRDEKHYSGNGLCK